MENIISTIKIILSKYNVISFFIVVCSSIYGGLTEFLSFQKETAILICVTLFFFLLSCLLFYLLVEIKDQAPLSFIDGRKGDELIEGITKAEKSIILTAFSMDTPSLLYKSALKDAINNNDNVVIKRYITSIHSKDSLFEYTKEHTQHHSYSEIILDIKKIPMDVYIIDGKSVYFYLPTTAESNFYKDGICFSNNEKIATLFRTMLESLSVTYGKKPSLSVKTSKTSKSNDCQVQDVHNL